MIATKDRQTKRLFSYVMYMTYKENILTYMTAKVVLQNNFLREFAVQNIWLNRYST